MKIYYISSVPALLPHHKKKLDEFGGCVLILGKKSSEEEVVNKIKDAEILIVAPSGIMKITDKMLSQLPQLKFITTTSTSHDFIDVTAAEKRGIVVSNCKGANAQSVAEAVWAMILALSRRVIEYANDAKFEGAYNFNSYTGKQIYGKTLGIIGLGDIGLKVASIARGFNMSVLGYNRSKKNLPNINEVTLVNLLKNSDIISINVPLSDETRDLISEKEIMLMKEGIILINTSDEEIVNKQAVLKYIQSGKLCGYGSITS